MKTLHLTVTKKWFDKIVSGRKRWEFREAKPYWQKRLDGNDFDLIRITNGYGKKRPYVVFLYRSHVMRCVKGVTLYCLDLHGILCDSDMYTGLKIFGNPNNTIGRRLARYSEQIKESKDWQALKTIDASKI